MESPFYPQGKSDQNIITTAYLEPILDSYSKTYLNVITFSDMPAGPLKNMVKTMNLPKLSPFLDMPSNSTHRGDFGCTHVLLKYPKYGFGSTVKSSDAYMMADDIPALFSYLKTHEYIVDIKLTSMMNKSRVTIGGISDLRYSGDRKMICMIQYSPQP